MGLRTKYPKGKLHYYEAKKKIAFSRIGFFLFIIVFLLLLFYQYKRIEKQSQINYAGQVNDYIKISNELNNQFQVLKENAGTPSRDELNNELVDISKAAEQLAENFSKIKVPKKFLSDHPFLVITFDSRAEAYNDFNTALTSAFTDNDVTASIEKFGEVFKKLALSDRSFRTFKSLMDKSLAEKGIKEEIEPSKTIIDEEIYEKENLLGFIQGILGIERVGELHGISIISIATKPKRERYIEESNLYVLPKADILMVTIEIVNQGNVEERNIDIKAILKPATSSKSQKYLQKIISLKPGDRKAVTFNNLLPDSDRGVINLLTLTAGPVPKEQNLYNNTLEYKFKME